jgi:hypothetical protein
VAEADRHRVRDPVDHCASARRRTDVVCARGPEVFDGVEQHHDAQDQEHEPEPKDHIRRGLRWSQSRTSCALHG